MDNSYDLPENYALFNESNTKNVSLVAEIEGADLISNRPIYTRIRYGMDIAYGDPTLVYGGLIKKEGVREILSLEGSSMSISQKLESEAGKASISQVTLSINDTEQYMTQLCSPSVILPEMLGRKVKVRLGFKEISYPEDYYVIFRGVITDIQSVAGKYMLQLSDPNATRRTQIFYTSKSLLVGNLTNSDTTVNVIDNSEFHEHILSPDGTYDVPRPWNTDGTYNVIAPRVTGVRTFLKIEEEYMEYGALDKGVNTFTVIRGARGTTAVSHDEGSDVSCCMEIRDNAMIMALKLMLSGWAGNYVEGLKIRSIVKTFDPNLGDQANSISLFENTDAVNDYGLTIGDYLTITGSLAGNNGQYFITRIEEVFDQPNRLIYLSKVGDPAFLMTIENSTPAVFGVRSQFDTYPINAGASLTPEDVDTAAHVDLKNSFISGLENDLEFFVTDKENSCKSFIESEIYLPTASYSLTKRGKLSVGYTLPPIAQLKLVFLTYDNIKDPDKIKVSRSLNSRKFYNEIDWDYDYADGRYESALRYLDKTSLATIGLASTLAIKSKGAKTKFCAQTTFLKRSKFLLSRYAKAATVIELKANWKIGNQIEAGDIVALEDEGNLKLANWGTGTRDNGVQLYEINDRSLNIISGDTTLKLISGFNFDISDRYATVSPSSVIVSGAQDHIIIQDSFGSIFPFNERKKWKDYLQYDVVLHTEDYTEYYYSRLTGFDKFNNYKLLLDGITDDMGAPITPPDFSILILDIPSYPDDTSKTHNAIYKSIHGHYDPDYAVASGATQTQFDVGVGEGVNFFIGSRVIVHNEDYTDCSDLEDELKVIDINGDTLTVDKAIGFIPDNTHIVSGVGFKDKQGFYRLI